MQTVTLSAEERETLERLTAQAGLTPEVRRAQALLWLAAGDSPQLVAKRLRVSRQTVYNWTASFEQRQGEENVEVRLADRKRSGRPPKSARSARPLLPPTIDPLIAAALSRDPREFGYHSILWTAKLLRQYLREVHSLPVTLKHINGALARLETCWTPDSVSEGKLPPHAAAA